MKDTHIHAPAPAEPRTGKGCKPYIPTLDATGADEIPTVQAYAIRWTSDVGFWCRHCRRAHLHGNPDGERRFHRLAHCLRGRGSPLDTPRGYFVEVVGEVERPTDLPRRRPEGEGSP